MTQMTPKDKFTPFTTIFASSILLVFGIGMLYITFILKYTHFEFWYNRLALQLLVALASLVLGSLSFFHPKTQALIRQLDLYFGYGHPPQAPPPNPSQPSEAHKRIAAELDKLLKK